MPFILSRVRDVANPSMQPSAFIPFDAFRAGVGLHPRQSEGSGGTVKKVSRGGAPVPPRIMRR